MIKNKRINSIVMSMILMLGSMLFSVAHAATPNAFLTTKVDVNGSQYWSSYKIVITNESSQAIDMRDSTIDIISDSDEIKSLDNISADGLSWSPFTLTNTEQGGSYTTEVKMNFPEGDWVNTKLAPGKTITITFGNSVAINIQTLNVYTNGDNPNPPEPAKNDASLTITAPVISDAGDNASATVTGPNGYTSTESISWGASKTISDLPYGHYVVRTNSVGDYTGGSDQAVDFSALNKTSSMTLQYTKPIAPAKAIFHINAVADATAPVQTLTFQVEGDSSSMKTMNATWGNTLEQDSLVNGSTYDVWLTSFKSKGFNYTPNCVQATPCTFVADKNTPQVLEVTYQAAVLPTGNVTVNVAGLPDGATASVKLNGVDKSDYSYNMSNMVDPKTCTSE